MPWLFLATLAAAATAVAEATPRASPKDTITIDTPTNTIPGTTSPTSPPSVAAPAPVGKFPSESVIEGCFFNKRTSLELQTQGGIFKCYDQLYDVANKFVTRKLSDTNRAADIRVIQDKVTKLYTDSRPDSIKASEPQLRLEANINAFTNFNNELVKYFGRENIPGFQNPVTTQKVNQYAKQIVENGVKAKFPGNAPIAAYLRQLQTTGTPESVRKLTNQASQQLEQAATEFSRSNNVDVQEVQAVFQGQRLKFSSTRISDIVGAFAGLCRAVQQHFTAKGLHTFVAGTLVTKVSTIAVSLANGKSVQQANKMGLDPKTALPEDTTNPTLTGVGNTAAVLQQQNKDDSQPGLENLVTQVSGDRHVQTYIRQVRQAQRPKEVQRRRSSPARFALEAMKQHAKEAKSAIPLAKTEIDGIFNTFKTQLNTRLGNNSSPIVMATGTYAQFLEKLNYLAFQHERSPFVSSNALNALKRVPGGKGRPPNQATSKTSRNPDLNGLNKQQQLVSDLKGIDQVHGPGINASRNTKKNWGEAIKNKNVFKSGEVPVGGTPKQSRRFSIRGLGNGIQGVLGNIAGMDWRNFGSRFGRGKGGERSQVTIKGPAA